MDDDTITTTTDTTGTIATEVTTADSIGTTPPAKLFTQEDMNRAAAKARDEGRRSATKQETKRDDKSVDADLRGELEELKLRNAFDRRVSKLDLKHEAEEDLFVLFKAQRPPDPDAWVKAKLESLNLKAAPAPNTGTAAPAALVAAASNTQPNAVNPTTSGGLPDPWNMTSEQLSLLGPRGIRELHEKILAQSSAAAGAPRRPSVPNRK